MWKVYYKNRTYNLLICSNFTILRNGQAQRMGHEKKAFKSHKGTASGSISISVEPWKMIPFSIFPLLSQQSLIMLARATSSLKHFLLVSLVVLFCTKDNRNNFVHTSPVSRQKELPQPLPGDNLYVDNRRQDPHPTAKQEQHPSSQTPTQVKKHS